MKATKQKDCKKASKKKKGKVGREFLCLKEACEYFGISKETLYMYKQKGLPFYQVDGHRKRQIRISEANAFMRQFQER